MSIIAAVHRATLITPEQAPPYSPQDAAWIKAFLVEHRHQVVSELLILGRQSDRRLSQEEMAERIGISTAWYGQLERGAVAWTARIAEAVCAVLKLLPPERDAFYHRVGLPVPPRSGPPTATAIELVDATPVPAFLRDRAGNVLYGNREFLEWGVFDPSANLFEWGICGQTARRALRSWETDWRGPMLDELKYSLAFSTGEEQEELKDVRARVLRGSPEVEHELRTPLRDLANGVSRFIAPPEEEVAQAYGVWTTVLPDRPDHFITSFIRRDRSR